MTIAFTKMHGLGNDFVIIDGRTHPYLKIDAGLVRALANRRRGVGCDQVIVLRSPAAKAADVFMEMYNADGSTVRACGNATRCVGRLMFDELGQGACVIETSAGLLPVREAADRMITVDFGLPRLAWDEIPLARACDTLHVALPGPMSDACCVNMGNPHAVFFVPDVAAVDLAAIGPRLENDALFPDRCNIEIAQILAPDRIRMRVWERGAGITEACGTGACATLVAAARRGLAGRKATIMLDGGKVGVEWRTDDHVFMTGPATMVYHGVLNDAAFT